MYDTGDSHVAAWLAASRNDMLFFGAASVSDGFSVAFATKIFAAILIICQKVISYIYIV
jgi:hypothetical protein